LSGGSVRFGRPVCVGGCGGPDGARWLILMISSLVTSTAGALRGYEPFYRSLSTVQGTVYKKRENIRFRRWFMSPMSPLDARGYSMVVLLVQHGSPSVTRTIIVSWGLFKILQSLS